MPNKDGTGPDGEGPKSGRGFGNCSQDKTESSENLRGRGCGRGKGIGRSRRCCKK